MEEGREERKVERKKGSIPEVIAKGGNKITHRPQNPFRKGTKIDKHDAEIDPKGPQSEAKTDNKIREERTKRKTKKGTKDKKEDKKNGRRHESNKKKG